MIYLDMALEMLLPFSNWYSVVNSISYCVELHKWETKQPDVSAVRKGNSLLGVINVVADLTVAG